MDYEEVMKQARYEAMILREVREHEQNPNIRLNDLKYWSIEYDDAVKLCRGKKDKVIFLSRLNLYAVVRIDIYTRKVTNDNDF